MLDLSIIGILGGFLGAAITIVLHEWVKALISSALGDPLPKRDGRLSPNPIKHIEPIGFIVMALIGFGWGKPLETASIYYKDRKKGTLITYTIPSIVNLLFGILLIPISLVVSNDNIKAVISITILLNLRHAFFNIIPIYPLDGEKILKAIRDPNQVISMANNQMIYQMLLIIFTIWGLTARIIDPICKLIVNAVSSLF